MTKTKSTKRALLMSGLVFVMCVSMLIGSTFAWFTDSVASADNKIVAGNLDVQLLMYNGTEYVDISESESPIFGEGSIAQNNNAETLWEPGKTQVAYLAIKNNGTLALKYTVGLDVQNVSKDLYEVMQYAITPDAVGSAPLTAWNAAAGKDVVAGTQSVSGNVDLGAGETHYFALSIHMDEEAGNKYQGGEVNFDLTVMATQNTVEFDSFDNQYDKDAIAVEDAAAAQAAIDNAVPGTTIQLAPGVNYGTLVFGQNAGSKVVDINDIGGDDAGNEHYSRYENITIFGAPGAIVDQIDFKVGWISNSEGASYVDIKNLTVKGVTFSGEKTAVNMESAKGGNLGIDGLNIVDCKMNDANGKDRFVFQQITGYKAKNDKTTGEYVMTTGVKNLTITGCEVTGAYQVIESRAMENLTITNNTFKDIKARDMLINCDTDHYPDVTYTGAITITGNTSIEGKERFVRASLNNTKATVTIKDNIVKYYMGPEDASKPFIQVEGYAGTFINENNVMTRARMVSDTAEFQDNLATAQPGNIIVMAPGNYDALKLTTSGTDAEPIVIQGAAGVKVETLDLNAAKNVVIEGVTFDAADAVVSGNYLTSITDNSWVGSAAASGIVIRNCTFTGTADASKYIPICFEYGSRSNDGSKNITVEGCKFECNAFNFIRFDYLEAGLTTIKDNIFGGTAYTTGHHAINMSGNASDVVLSGNTFINWKCDKTAFATNRHTGYTGGIVDIEIVGNTFNNTLADLGDGIDGVIEIKSGYQTTDSTVTISGNFYEGGLAGQTDATAPMKLNNFAK